MKRERNFRAWLLALMLILLLLSTIACSHADQTPSPAAPLPSPAGKIVIENSSFEPSNTVITVGATVTWTNRDNTSYSITEDNQSFAFNLAAGDSFKVTFKETGVFNYHCSLYPGMQGTIVVANGDACWYSGDATPASSDIVNKVKPSVVAVNAATTTQDVFGRPVSEELAGTGWVLDKNGFIVTNNHVVEGAGNNVTVTLDNGQTYQAKTVRADPVNDLAIIDIGVKGLPAVKLGDSSSVKIGAPVIALGNALGEGIRATQGIISNTDSTFTVDNRETLYNVFQTTAPINFGNSGGPLINMNGEVIGITSAAKLARTGTVLTAYAISSDIALPILQSLINPGYVTRPWLGVTTSSVSQFQPMGYTLNLAQGALVTKVIAGSSAEIGGLVPGDVIASFGGQSISTTDDLIKAVRSASIGQSVKVTYWRDNVLQTTLVTLQESSPS